MLHTNIYRKTLFRQPIRTLILFLLLAAITYAFVSHAAESLLVANEISYLEEYYQPIGTLTAADGDVSEGAALLEECSYMELSDARKMCPGTLEGMQNADIDAILASALEYYSSDVVFVGELKEKNYVERSKGPGGYYELTFEVCEMEAGYTEYMQSGREVHVRSLPDLPDGMQQEYYPLVQDEAFVAEYDTLETGRQYLLRVHYREGAGINAAFAAQNGFPGSNFVLDKLVPTGESVYFYEVIEGESVDYDAPELEGLFSYLQFLRHNQSAMLFTGTKDMSRMPICQESSRRYYLTEGRWIDREDDLNGNRVCVIHNYFAKQRGLGIGDKIQVRLEDMDEYVYGYAMPEEWEQWAACEGTEEELEIVGIYEDLETNSYFMSAYSTFVYIPSSCIPQDYSTEDMRRTAADSYSFVLRKPSDQQRFMEEYKDSLEGLGIQIQFVENNADNFAISAQQLQSSTMFSTVLFGAVLILTVLFLCGLYLAQRSREYAIARALGVSGRKAAVQMILSFGWIGIPGVLAGGALGWYRTIRSAEQILGALTAEVEKSGHALQGVILSVGWLAGMIAAVLLTVGLILFAGSLMLARKSVLTLIQGGANVRREKGRKEESKAAESIPLPLNWKEIQMPQENAANDDVSAARKNRRKAELIYIARHQIRSAGKSMLILLLGVGAVLTFGWMYRTIQNNLLEAERIYETTVIEGEIIKANSGNTYSGTGGGVIVPKMVEAVKESGLVSGVYTEETGVLRQIYKTQKYQKEVQTETETPTRILSDVPILGIYDWDGFLEETGANLSVQFEEGKSGNSFAKDRESGDLEKYEVILSENQLASLGAKIGDVVCLLADTSDSLNLVSCVIVGSYQGNLASGIPSDAVIVHAVMLHDIVGENYYDLVARFTFDAEKNRELMEREEELEQMVKEWRGNLVAMRLMIWDEELYAAVEPMERTLSLFGILYPVAMAVFFVLGFGFQLLLLLLRRKEAAILRVLGNSPGTVRKLFLAEQSWLCVFGMLIGVILLFALGWQSGFRVWAAAGLYLLGSAAGVTAGVIAVTAKRPLELLQTHE